MYQRRLIWLTENVGMVVSVVVLTMVVTEGFVRVRDGVRGFLTEAGIVVRAGVFITLVVVTSGCTTQAPVEQDRCLIYTHEIDKLSKEQGKTLWEY